MSYNSRRLGHSGRREWDWPFLFLLALACIVRLAVVFCFAVPGSDPLQERQVETALRLLSGGCKGPQPLEASLSVGYWTLLASILRGVQGAGEGASAFYDSIRESPTLLLLIGRLGCVAISLGTLSWLYFWLGRHFDLSRGRIALSLLVCSPLLVRTAGFGSVETFTTAFVFLALGQAVEIFERGRGRSYMAAGVYCGLAMSCQLHGFLLLPTIIWAHFNTHRLGQKSFF